MKPYSGFTEAVIEPLAILNASVDKADIGISNKFAPLPLKPDADTGTLTTIPFSGEIDADAEPDIILLESIAKLTSEIFLNCEPSPTKYEPVGTYKFPLTIV